MIFVFDGQMLGRVCLWLNIKTEITRLRLDLIFSGFSSQYLKELNCGCLF